ncbi:spore germination protein [Neobacillus niacini]|uniref:spore germination protein n=1 Tax=Neobacillus niacini TaxID=86668 RepID=UPI0021CB6E4D|nr:spore germination protein [Neobacillus niacini]MCM3764879.1 spore germination protein [Neobacillus niacini]
MFFRKRPKQLNKINYETKESSILELLEKAKQSSDFETFSPVEKNAFLSISYYKTLVDMDLFNRIFLKNLKEKLASIKNLADLKSIVPIDSILITQDVKEVEKGLYHGAAVIHLHNNLQECALVGLSDPRLGKREVNETENEFSVIGPKIGFIEDLSTNLHLLRSQLITSDLIFEEFEVGTRSKTKVVVAHLSGVTNPDYVQTARQRIQDLDIDVLYDNSQLEELISDYSTTPFPLFINTERVDRTIYSLIRGNVVILTDNSCYALIGPAALMNFFSTPEDFYLPWVVASFFRIIRIFGMLFSIFVTSFYVAILTYHFEIVPKDLLGPIIFSRANVPFPPVVEVLFLEITIELLREAGARLPTKIGQTLGIVGGIVIGQATVQAALTSNILLILVALGALSSFTTPIYKMSNTVRLLRYPFILLAAIWGGFGIYIGVIFLVTHLLRLKSLGSPYLLPLSPYRKGGLSNTFIRKNDFHKEKRNKFLRALSRKRFNPITNKDPEEGLNSE